MITILEHQRFNHAIANNSPTLSHNITNRIHVKLMNYTQVCFPKFPIQQIAQRIIGMRQISRIDQRLFMSALLSKHALSLEEQNLIEQIYRGLSLGWIRVVE